MRFRGSFNALNPFLQFLLRVFDLVVATIEMYFAKYACDGSSSFRQGSVELLFGSNSGKVTVNAD